MVFLARRHLFHLFINKNLIIGIQSEGKGEGNDETAVVCIPHPHPLCYILLKICPLSPEITPLTLSISINPWTRTRERLSQLQNMSTVPVFLVPSFYSNFLNNLTRHFTINFENSSLINFKIIIRTYISMEEENSVFITEEEEEFISSCNPPKLKHFLLCKFLLEVKLLCVLVYPVVGWLVGLPVLIS